MYEAVWHVIFDTEFQCEFYCVSEQRQIPARAVAAKMLDGEIWSSVS